MNKGKQVDAWITAHRLGAGGADGTSCFAHGRRGECDSHQYSRYCCVEVVVCDENLFQAQYIYDSPVLVCHVLSARRTGSLLTRPFESGTVFVVWVFRDSGRRGGKMSTLTYFCLLSAVGCKLEYGIHASGDWSWPLADGTNALQ